MDKTMLLKPRMSEKAYATSLDLNTYVFEVPKTANKLTIINAVESQFGVKVQDINILIVKGKIKKSYQKRNRPVDGRRTDIKKAYVRLVEGNSIDIFNEEEKVDKKSDKNKPDPKSKDIK